MEKEEVLKVLESEGRFKEYDDLYRNDVTLADWVSRNEDLIRSNRNIAKAVGVDTPHGGVDDSYFEGQETAKEKYDRDEKKFTEEQAKKQQLADEYQRAKDIEDIAEFRKDKGILRNLAALGMKLTPQAAKNVYIKEGYNPGQLALQGGLGTMANVSELLPGPGKIGKVVTTFGGPAIRAGQDIYEGKSLSEVGSRFAHDAGLNTLFEYMPVQEAYNYAKRILGKQGGAGEKAAADIVGETLEKADALEHLKDLKDARRARMHEVTNFQQGYEQGLVNDLDALKFAESIEDEFPKVAESLRKEINLNAASRQADIRSKTAITDKTKAQVDADRILADKKIPEQHEIVRTDLRDARKEAKDKYLLSDLKVDPEGYLIRPAADLKQAYKVYNPSKAAKVIAEIAPTGRKLAKTYTGPDRESSAPEDKNYNNAIEYIISNYKRQWDAGFKPRGGIELEAWKKYKGIE